VVTAAILPSRRCTAARFLARGRQKRHDLEGRTPYQRVKAKFAAPVLQGDWLLPFTLM
jgi:hypothetical protein